MKIVFSNSSLIASHRALKLKQGEIIKHGDPLIRPNIPGKETWPTSRLVVAFSKDGIHFKPAAVTPVIPLMKFPARDRHNTWFSDVAPAFKNAPTGKT